MFRSFSVNVLPSWLRNADQWLDGWIAIYVLFSSISVMSGRREGDNKSFVQWRLVTAENIAAANGNRTWHAKLHLLTQCKYREPAKSFLLCSVCNKTGLIKKFSIIRFCLVSLFNCTRVGHALDSLMGPT